MLELISLSLLLAIGSIFRQIGHDASGDQQGVVVVWRGMCEGVPRMLSQANKSPCKIGSLFE